MPAGVTGVVMPEQNSDPAAPWQASSANVLGTTSTANFGPPFRCCVNVKFLTPSLDARTLNANSPLGNVPSVNVLRSSGLSVISYVNLFGWAWANAGSARTAIDVSVSERMRMRSLLALG